MRKRSPPILLHPGFRRPKVSDRGQHSRGDPFILKAGRNGVIHAQESTRFADNGKLR